MQINRSILLGEFLLTFLELLSPAQISVEGKASRAHEYICIIDSTTLILNLDDMVA